MINRRSRRCCCMNNNFYNTSNLQDENQENIEEECNNVCESSCQNYNNDCSCGFDDEEMDVFPQNPMLGQSYVPFQTMEETFKPCSGLDNGTIFPELVSPYMPGDSMRQIAYIKNTNTIGEGCNTCQ